MSANELISLDAAIKRYGYSQATLYRRMADGEIAYTKAADGSRLLYAAPLQNYTRSTTPWTADERDSRIIARLKAGDTQRSIAAKFGVSQQRVQQIAKLAGVVSPRLRNRPRV